MKANEFVKKFGWGAVKEIIKNAPDWAFETAGINDYANWGWSKIYPMNAYCKIDDLKRLVESWELMESHKTKRYSALDNAKQHVLTLAHMEEFEKMYALEKAIADVESCQ